MSVFQIVPEGNHLILKEFKGENFIYTDGSQGPNELAKIEFFGETARDDAKQFAQKHKIIITGD